MSENFKFELVKPDQFVFSSEVSSVKIPCYEGEMTILRDHISLITFLRPGIVEIDKPVSYTHLTLPTIYSV